MTTLLLVLIVTALAALSVAAVLMDWLDNVHQDDTLAARRRVLRELDRHNGR